MSFNVIPLRFPNGRASEAGNCAWKKKKSTKNDAGIKQPQKGFIDWSTPTSPLGLLTSSRLQGSKWQSVCLAMFAWWNFAIRNRLNIMNYYIIYIYTLIQRWTEIIHFGKICRIIHHALIIYSSVHLKSDCKKHQMSSSGTSIKADSSTFAGLALGDHRWTPACFMRGPPWISNVSGHQSTHYNDIL